MENNKEIYLDNAATTKVLSETVALMQDIMLKDYGNPSSIHLKGFEAEKIMDDAREKVAKALNCKSKEIYFTSGGTESNNIAIIGGVHANKRVGNHIITTQIEHSSVSNAIKYLEEEEGYEVTYLPCDENGIVRLDALMDNIQKDTVLVSIMYVNNETGSIQPINEIGNIIKRMNDKCLFHVDAVQAVGKLPIDLKYERINFLSASAHKFYGPKGCGFLYVKENTKVNPIIFGGGQENNLRSGTHNLPGIAGCANSLDLVSTKLKENYEYLSSLKEAFAKGLEQIDGCIINGIVGKASSPYIINASFKDLRAEVLIHALEEKGVYVSAQSACSSHAKKKSGVLSAMGLASDRIESSLRFSFSIDTKKEDLDFTIKALDELVNTLSKFKRK